MQSNIIYFDFSILLALHDKIIKEEGGLGGVKDEWQIISVLTHIQNDTYYPTILDKAVHLFHSLVKFHCFNDANKRTAVCSLVNFLVINDCALYEWVDAEVKTLGVLEAFAILVATNHMDKEDLKMGLWYLYEDFFNSAT